MWSTLRAVWGGGDSEAGRVTIEMGGWGISELVLLVVPLVPLVELELEVLAALALLGRT